MTLGNSDLSSSVTFPLLQSGPYLTYIREVTLDGERGFAVCSDEGVPLAIFASMEAAYFSARQFDLSPQSLH